MTLRMLKTASRRAGTTAEMLAACVMTNVSTGAQPGLASCPHIGRRVRGLLGDCAGVITLTTAFAAFTLIGTVGLSVTAGDWYLVHRAMQSAADAGALGGAVELANGSSTSVVTTAAKNDTANNGFKDGQNGVTVTASITNNQFVTVTVSQPAQLMLAGLFMGTAPTISATAQAGIVYNGSPACMLATSPNAPNAVSVVGNGTIQANGCAIVANSNNSAAITTTGNAVLDSAKLCGPGGYQNSGGNTQLNPAYSKCAPIADPYANYPSIPEASAPCQYGNSGVGISSGTRITGNTTLSPGVYCGGISISSTANVTFQPGLYVLRDGGITSSGQAQLTGQGVTFYLSGSNSQVNIPNDDIAFSGQAQVNFKAATASQLPSDAQSLAGMIFFQDVDSASTGQIMNTLSGNSSVKYEGTLYFGNQNVTVVGNGVADSTSPFTTLIGNTITYNGNGTLVFNSDYANSNVPPPNMRLGQVSLTN